MLQHYSCVGDQRDLNSSSCNLPVTVTETPDECKPCVSHLKCAGRRPDKPPDTVHTDVNASPPRMATSHFMMFTEEMP